MLIVCATSTSYITIVEVSKLAASSYHLNIIKCKQSICTFEVAKIAMVDIFSIEITSLPYIVYANCLLQRYMTRRAVLVIKRNRLLRNHNDHKIS